MTDPTQINLFPENDEPQKSIFPAPFLNPDQKALAVRSITIDGFKGFDKTKVTFNNLSLLTGPNNSGKSTILQAVSLGFECFRRVLDSSNWTVQKTGRSISEFEFLPVNSPRDLWFKTVWKRSTKEERYIVIKIEMTDEIEFTARIRYLYGALNVNVQFSKEITQEQAKQLAYSIPIYIPSAHGPDAHEERFSLAQINRHIGFKEPNKVLRNILFELQKLEKVEELAYLNSISKKYFGVELKAIKFDEKIDLEIRSEVAHEKFGIDIISEGSGYNQLITLAAIIAWRKPAIILLDEPDAHLHSTLQAVLLDFINDLITNYRLQIIISTHSRDMIGQAPIGAIIPVDRNRSDILPLQSMEHLLLEYQRQGAISNVDLALLYQTKKCLFVEGALDVLWLPKIADRLGYPIFQGRDQLVLFEFSGVDKISYLPDLCDLFKRIIGSELTWGVLRDYDANTDKVMEAIKTKYATKIPLLYVWDCYSLENLLLTEDIITKACSKKATSKFTGNIGEYLAKALEKHSSDYFASLTTKTQTAYRTLSLSERHTDDGAKDAFEYFQSLKTPELKAKRLPGKRIIGSLFQDIQENHGINLRIEDLISVIDRDNAPEITKALDSINSFFFK